MEHAEYLTKKDRKALTRKITKQSDSRMSGGDDRSQDPPEKVQDKMDKLYDELDKK